MREGARESGATHGHYEAALHCTPEGRFMTARPTLFFDNVWIIRSLETQIRLIYTNELAALESVVRTERQLNLEPRSLAEQLVQQQIPAKLHKIAREQGLKVACAWADVYDAVYARSFVSRRELYTAWLRRLATSVRGAVDFRLPWRR